MLTRREAAVNSRIMLIALLMLAVAGCKKQPPPEEPLKIPPRTDFAPADFGIGRPHTKNAACNREIDQLLETVRLCFNTRPGGSCDALQQENSGKISRIKNSLRCGH